MTKILAVIVSVSLAATAMLSSTRFLQKIDIRVSENQFLNMQAKYQMVLLGIMIVVLAITYMVNPTGFKTYFQLGDIKAPAAAVRWLGIKQNESWRSVGIGFSIGITLVTSIYMFLGVKSMGGNINVLSAALPWIILFSLTNSFSEEAIFRMGVIGPLYQTIDIKYIILLSAILFGLPHFRGVPNGITGVFLAGILGWILAKSVIETKGLFWAVWIHFIQDVVIFSGITIMQSNKT